MMPFIEELKRTMWGEYHPKNKAKSCVMVGGIGCVFIGTIDQCQQYMRENEDKYRRA